MNLILSELKPTIEGLIRNDFQNSQSRPPLITIHHSNEILMSKKVLIDFSATLLAGILTGEYLIYRTRSNGDKVRPYSLTRKHRL